MKGDPAPRAKLVHGCSKFVAPWQTLRAAAATRPILAWIPRVRPDVVVAHRAGRYKARVRDAAQRQTRLTVRACPRLTTRLVARFGRRLQASAVNGRKPNWFTKPLSAQVIT